MNQKDEKYLKGKFDLISAEIGGVVAGAYMLGDMGKQFSRYGVEKAEEEVWKIILQIYKHFHEKKD